MGKYFKFKTKQHFTQSSTQSKLKEAKAKINPTAKRKVREKPSVKSREIKEKPNRQEKQ